MLRELANLEIEDRARRLRIIASLIGAIGSMLFTVFSTVTMWVFSAAAVANADAASIQRVKLWVMGFSSFSLVGLLAAVWLLRMKRHGQAAGIALLPSIVMGGTLLYKLLG